MEWSEVRWEPRKCGRGAAGQGRWERRGAPAAFQLQAAPRSSGSGGSSRELVQRSSLGLKQQASQAPTPAHLCDRWVQPAVARVHLEALQRKSTGWASDWGRTGCSGRSRPAIWLRRLPPRALRYVPQHNAGVEAFSTTGAAAGAGSAAAGAPAAAAPPTACPSCTARCCCAPCPASPAPPRASCRCCC